MALEAERVANVAAAAGHPGYTLVEGADLAVRNNRVLLVDMDLRRGRLHRSLGMDREPGVSDVLKEGQEVWVKLLGFDDRGKVRLSMKVVDQESVALNNPAIVFQHR